VELYSEAVQHWYLPWVKVVGRIPASTITSVVLDRGIVWDRLIIETKGGANVLIMPGLRKKDADFMLSELDDIME